MQGSSKDSYQTFTNCKTTLRVVVPTRARGAGSLFVPEGLGYAPLLPSYCHYGISMFFNVPCLKLAGLSSSYPDGYQPGPLLFWG
jgi:hypothetical protein